MSSQIQGFRMQGNVASIDFNAECTQFVAGGKESKHCLIQASRLWN